MKSKVTCWYLKTQAIAILSLSIVGIIGCAPQNFGIDSDAFLYLEYKETGDIALSTPFTVNLVKFDDTRKIKSRVGYMNHATYKTKQDPSVILANALSVELQTQGIKVNKYSSNGELSNNHPVIQGNLRFFYANTNFVNTFTPNMTANIVLEIEVQKDGRTHKKLFSEATKHYTHIGYANDWKIAFEKSLKIIIPRITNEVSNIIKAQ